jgi:hypothetical protein
MRILERTWAHNVMRERFFVRVNILLCSILGVFFPSVRLGLLRGSAVKVAYVKPHESV